MNRNHRLLPALAFTAMAALGWNLGGNSVQKPADPSSVNTRSPRPEWPVRVRPGPSGEAAQRLAAIRATADPAERMRATIDLATTLPSAEFASWLGGGWFSPSGGMESTVFTEILMDRWRLEDPEGLLLWCREKDTRAALPVLDAWAETEPQRLLDFFKSHPGDQAEFAALAKISVKYPELALRRFREMAADGSLGSDDSYSASVLSEIIKSPAALEAVIDTLPSSLKSEAERFLIARKMEDSFATEIRKLWDRPDGLEIFKSFLNDQRSLTGKLPGELSNLPASWRDEIASTPYAFVGAKDAVNWLNADLEGCGFTSAQTQLIRSQALSRMVDQEPETVLKVMDEFELPASARSNLILNAFANLREKPEQAEALLALLGSDEDREAARSAMVVKEPEPEIQPIKQPAEWLATVAALDPAKSPSDYLRMVEDWEPEKAAVLVAGFHSLPEDQKANLATCILEGGLYGDSPLRGEALAYFVAHPRQGDPSSDDPFARSTYYVLRNIELTSDYVVKLGKENPDKAGDWIQSLPDGEAKLWAARNLQNVWSLYDPAAAERWMKTLPAATRAKVKELK